MLMRYTKAKIKNGWLATIFIITLHHSIKDIDQRETVLNKISQICAYTDGAITIRSRQWLV